MLFSGKWLDPVIGIDIHLIQPPGPVPPIPVPHPFIGIVYDPAGLLMGMAIGAVMTGLFGGSFKGPVLINGMPAANTGTQVKGMPVHVPIGGTFIYPPKNEGTIITGSKTVHVLGTSGARLTSMVMTCNDVINLPTSVVMSIPMGPPVFTGGPTAVDWLAVALSAIRTQWVSDKLHALLKAKPGSWTSKIICFFTGHPVDVVSGRVVTDHLDLDFPGPIPFRFERNYFSSSTYEGPFGRGWHHSYDQHITVRDGMVYLQLGDGRELQFDLPEPGETIYDPAERLSLTREYGGFTLRTVERRTLTFGGQGWRQTDFPVTRIEDRNGNAITFQYERGRLASITDCAGRHIGIVTDEQGRIRQITAPHTQWDGARMTVAEYDYDENNQLVEVRDCLGQPFRYKYENHLLVEETNRNGLSFHFKYDSDQPDARCIRTWGDGGIYDHKITYHVAARMSIVENSLGAKTVYQWNEDQLVTSITDAAGGVRKLAWSETRRQIGETDPHGAVRQWEFNESGKLVKYADPIGQTFEMQYDQALNPVLLTLPDGNFLKRGFDARGNVVSVENSLGGRRLYSYDQNGRIAAETDPYGDTTYYQYNDRGEIVEIATPQGGRFTFSFTPHGRMASYTTPAGFVQTYTYDLKDRLIQVRYPDGTRRRYAFDAEDNVVETVDNEGYLTQYKYAGFNKVIERVDPTGHRLRYEYDTEEHLTGLVNQKGELYRIVYDRVGRSVEEEGFDGVIRRYRYENSHLPTTVEEISSERDADGVPLAVRISKITRDALGRILEKTLPSGIVHQFEYNSFGPTKAATPTRSVVLKYNTAGGVVEADQNGAVVRYEYDITGRRIARISPSGRSVLYRYESTGQPRAIEIRSPHVDPLAVQFAYGPEGQLMSAAYPGGVRMDQSYDEGGRLIKQVRSGPWDQTTRQYRYTGGGHIASIQDSRTGIQEFQYDPVGQLIESVHAGVREPVEFDPAGNITAAGQDRFAIGKGNRLKAKNGDDYIFNGFGDLVERPVRSASGIEKQRLFYDDQHRLIRVETADGRVLGAYEYDAFGRRVRKIVSNRETDFLWDDGVLLAESDGRNQNEYVFVGFTPLAQTSDGKTYFYHLDYSGRPEELTDERGETVWAGHVDAFERHATETTGVHQPFGLPGHYEDQESGLRYSVFRYYDPDSARFINQDPLGLRGSLNFYRYVRDPIHCLDPLGLIPMTYVPYGGSSLQPVVDDLYRSGGANPWKGNAAAMQWVTEEGETLTRAFSSEGAMGAGGRHAEEVMLDFIRENGISPDAVKQIYSELSPCDKNGHICMDQLDKFFKDNKELKVEFSFFYPDEYGKKTAATRERYGCG